MQPSKYSSAPSYQKSGSYYSKDVVGNYNYKSELPRSKQLLDKNAQNPPVSYKPPSKIVSSRSRDPSPVQHNICSRLEPPRIRRSLSKEKTNVPSYIQQNNVKIPRFTDMYRNNDIGNTTKPIKSVSDTYNYKIRPREDENKSSNKYISSRFLPKNAIEKSYSGYSRSHSSLAKANETSRKNRELLKTINVEQERDRRSRSITTSISTSSESSKEPKQHNFIPTKKIESEITSEKEKLKQNPEIDKINTMTKNLKLSTPPSTPWTSILDMKFSKPTGKLAKNSSNPKFLEESPSRGHSCVPEDKKHPKKLLIPQIKNRSNTLLNSLGGQPNKDFRKSVLNMSDMARKKAEAGNNSSSADSVTDVSDNSSKSIRISKLPQKMNFQRNKSCEDNITLKYSMSQTNIKCNEVGKESQSEEKMKWVVGSSSEEDSERISTHCDVSLSYDDSQKDEKCEIPKTLKIINHIPSGEIPWWLDEKAEAPEGVQVLYPDYINGNEIRDENGRIVYKLRKNQSGDSSWWNEATDPSESQKSNENLEPEHLELHQIRHIDSGERSWWMSSHENLTDVTEDKQKEKSGDLSWSLGDRASPEGIEMPKSEEKLSLQKQLFISKHKDIDDVLGGSSQILSPLMEKIFFHSGKNEEINEISNQNSNIQGGVENKATFKLDDAALQLYKDGDYGSYLDLDSSISEQQEEFEGFQESKKNSIVLRTQLSVRVHTIIEKLLTCEGRDLRRALFSLKQIFQEDKDLVHEFVQNDGLSCLIKVGSVADQNYQNYILRALGQVMLYVDGMNGVIEHNPTIQWLYSLISSKFRLVVKTALKLLLVFVEYTDSNCMLLVQAVKTVDCSHGLLPWQNVMKLLRDFNSADTELLIYATTLINKVLSGVPDQDCYYDLTDALEEQGIEHIIQRYMSKPGTDLDLLQQFQIYEAVLQYEDGVENSGNLLKLLDESIRKTLRRKSGIVTPERRKSRRHSTGTSNVCNFNSLKNKYNLIGVQPQPTTNEDDNDTSSSQSSEAENLNLNGKYKENIEARSPGVTPALRQRRERVERQRNFLKQQEDTISKYKRTQNNEEFNNNKINVQVTNGSFIKQNPSRRDTILPVSNINIFDTDEGLNKKPWIFNMIYKKKNEELDGEENEPTKTNGDEKSLLLQLKRENTVKDLTQKLASQNILHSPPSEDKISRIGDMSGLISKAKEGLAKSKSKVELLKSPTNELAPKFEIKMSENELRWEEMTLNMNRRLHLCDMDFTDLGSEDEIDIVSSQQVNIGIPPPPPPFQKENTSTPPPPPLNTKLQNPPIAPNFPSSNFCLNSQKKTESKLTLKKNKKTVKLFWKEVRDDVQASSKVKTGNIWEELTTVNVDTQKLEHLFESRAKDLLTKKQQEMNKNKEIIVLDPKRSNAINIGMTKLPPPRSIKAAILKMDATIMNREGIEKLLTMLPTKDERTRIQEAQTANPDIPLGNAEQFLLTLASISELPARLKLWAFKLDFENTEREIAEPLMDLKQGIESLKGNETFKAILSTLLSIGNFLNGAEVKGFQIDYLSKVPEVKDTVHKHSLLHHLCHIVLEKFPHATDLYSEIGALTRASKIDFDELAINKQKLEDDCKASWDHLKLISKHDGSSIIKGKMSDFLTDCAERIILLGIIHRRVMNRFHKFLLWLGIPIHQISDIKPNEFCKIISEFALEYRTTRERVIQQLEKKANHRERNKTRGKMITDLVKFKSKEDRADEELRHLLGSDLSDVESFQGTLQLRRTRKESSKSFLENHNGNLTDGDDELLESLVKTATKGPSRIAPRERKRTRHSDRKSLRRTLKNGLTEEEKLHLSAFIKGY